MVAEQQDPDSRLGYGAWGHPEHRCFCCCVCCGGGRTPGGALPVVLETVMCCARHCFWLGQGLCFMDGLRRKLGRFCSSHDDIIRCQLLCYSDHKELDRRKYITGHTHRHMWAHR